MFDVQTLVDIQIEGSNSTSAIPVPEGEYIATVKEFKPRTWNSKDGTQSGVSLDISWEIEDANVAAITGRDKSVVKQSVGLDFTDSNQLDMGRGKNVGLGRLREAIGQNEAGKSFSFNNLPGQIAKVSVKHRSANDGTDTVYAEVKAVTKAS